MTYVIGRGVRVEIGTTEGSAKTVSAVTKANPGVASATSHGMASTPLDGNPRSSSTAAIPSRRVATTRSGTGLTVR